MAKTKSPTPQELYLARKQREEQERRAYLPPGLVNHGNTCFMNSVLQGLIATRLLSNLVHFEPIPPEVQRHSQTLLASQRSPQLTNGHELGGQYEQKWDNSMPIGDVFVGVMYRAWEVQRHRRRESLSPKQLLTTLGQKYDQYLDFAQQDAHEFLRILLDAMRMEEFDVIKKRQPPTRKPRRRSTITPANIATFGQESPEDESMKLMSLSDMLFGGQLTSILVCQKCKHISQTYEDFNDLSLSIKAEDYAKERKRDRLKNLAKKMGMGGSGKRKVSKNAETPVANASEVAISAPLPPAAPRTSSSSNQGDSLNTVPSSGNAVNGVRASSVPPSPSAFADHEQEPPLDIDGARRRSLDGALGGVNGSEDSIRKGNGESEIDDEDGVVVDVSDAVPDPSPSPSTGKRFPSGLGVAPPTPDEKRIEFAEQPKIDRPEKDKDSDKAKEKDSWAKIGRRISMTVVGLGGKDKGKGKDKEKRKSRSRSRTSVDLSSSSMAEPSSATESFTPEIRLSRPSLSPERPQSTPPEVASRKDNENRTSDEKEAKRARSRTHSLSPSSSPSPSTTALLMTTTANTFSPPFFQRRSSRPPKASRAEEEYLRAILADVTTSSSTNGFGLGIFNHHHSHHLQSDNHNSAETFSSSVPSLPANQGLLHSATTLSLASSSSITSSPSAASSSSPSGGNALWAKLGQLPQLQLQLQLAGVEECLKMFTAVEVLDGENMVGCRRCWKIANGWYEAREQRREERKQKKEEEAGEEKGGEDSDEDNEDEDEDDGRDGDESGSEDEDNTSLAGRARSLSLTGEGVGGGTHLRQSSSAPASPVHDIPSSLSTPSIAMYAHRGANSSFSVASSPANVDSGTAESSKQDVSPTSTTSTHVPSISTISVDPPAPDSPSLLTARPNGLFHPETRTPAQAHSTATDSKVSLLSIPSSTTRHHRTDTEDTASSASATDEYSSDGAESDTTSVSTVASMSASVHSAESSTWTSVDHPTPSGDSSRSRTSSVRPDEKTPVTPMQKSFSEPPQTSTNPSPSFSSSKSKAKKSKSKAPKPVIMRPAYKRYLIATPPPILVIHLKRFQQLSKTSMMMSFSSGFKKLDDYVAFPEYLDLTPFLAPKKEDFGLGKKGNNGDAGSKDKKKAKDAGKDREVCMYRLYAVVVHIGNMLGGHYVAYTALPNSRDPGMVPDESIDGSTTNPSIPKGPRQWAYISDTVVRLATLEEVLKAKAYICMYERI